MLHLAVLGRDAEAALQCLRQAALELEEKDAHRVVQTLDQTLDDASRAWLRKLL